MPVLCALLVTAPLYADAPADTAAIDAYIAAQAEREHGEEYREARRTTTGELTHDDIAETVVLYTVEGQGGSNDYRQYLAVFARREGRLVALAYVEVGGKRMRAIDLVSIHDGAIVLATTGYAAKDPSCCPSVKGTTRYVLVHGTLREEKLQH